MAAASRDKWCDAQMYITSRFLTSGTTITVNPGKCSKELSGDVVWKRQASWGDQLLHIHTHIEHFGWWTCGFNTGMAVRTQRVLAGGERESCAALFCFLAQFSTCVIWNNVKGSVVIFAFCHTSHYSLHSDSVCLLWNLQHFPHLYLL